MKKPLKPIFFKHVGLLAYGMRNVYLNRS